MAFKCTVPATSSVQQDDDAVRIDALLAQLFRGSFALLLVTCTDENSDPFFAELTCGFQPDAFVGAGNQGNFLRAHIDKGLVLAVEFQSVITATSSINLARVLLRAVLVRLYWIENALPTVHEVEGGHAEHEHRIVPLPATTQ